jgi:hypothetical protein
MNFSNSSKRSGGSFRKALQVLGVMFGVLLLCLPAFSQGNAGRITGTVTDTTGGTISGATVSVVDTERGVTRTLTTDDAGLYNAPNLTPGNYTVRAEAKGFKKLERQNVVVQVGQEIRVDLTVQPGAQEQTVTVTEAVPLVETTTATLGGTLENTEIADLPLNGRDYQNLLALRPGVMLQVGGGPWTQSTNGVRPDQSVWLVDGVINSNFYDGRPVAGMPSPITDGATILPIDSIQEFNLMENPKAEYGWKAGAVVNVGIKSGTNTLHGSAYGFYRSAAWDARNYFNSAPQGTTCVVGSFALGACDKTPTQLKQFGGSVGGPIKKDKLFYFANYEGLRNLIGNSFGTTGGSGVPVTIPSSVAPATPNTTATSNCSAAVLAVNPTADCNLSMVDAINSVACTNATTCNAALVSAVSLKLAGCSVGTTMAGTVCSGGYFANNPTSSSAFLSTFPNINNSDNGVGKIDYHINDKNTVNGDFIIGRYKGDGEDRGFINRIFNNNYTINTWTTSGNWDYTPNSRMVNEVRFGYDRITFLTGSDDASLGVSKLVNTGSTLPGLPTISVGNPTAGTAFGLFGTWHNRPGATSPNPYWDAQESLSYLVGKHSLKFGGEFAHTEGDVNTPDYGRGRLNFKDLTHFFTGATKTGKGKGGQFFVGNANRRLLSTNTAAFVQDDWRMSQKFTLNLGMRYSYASPLREANNLWANFDPNSPTGLVQQGQPGVNTVVHPDRSDFSPRVGFAYDVNVKGRTVVLGGFSIMYESFTAVEWIQQNQFQQAGGSSVSLLADPTGALIDTGSCSLVTPVTCQSLGGNIVTKAAKFSSTQLCWDPALASCNGGPTVFPSNTVVTCSAGTQCNLMAVDPNLKTPYVMNFNLGVTHAFTNDLSLEVGYVGNHGARLTGFSDINQCPPNVNNCVQPYASKFPYFGYINKMTNDVRSNYHSMQATLTKRMSHGVSLVAGYTFAHGLDSASLNRFALLPQNAYNPGAEYGNSDFDVRHRLTLTGTYNIPGIKGFAQLLEGWQINAIATLQSGQPWQVNDYNAGPYPDFGNGFSGTGDNSDRWDFFGNPADFKGTQTSIPYCTSVDPLGNVRPFVAANVSCSTTTGVSNIVATPANSSTLIANCIAKAPDASTLADGGCFISANGNSVMVPQTAGTFGTMGRNIFRDSGFRNLDFSVFKNFKWKERYGAQFRLEIFNILNHPAIENPYGASNGSSGGNNDPSSPAGFGAAIGTPDVVAGNPVVGSGDNRAIQVGLKLTF